MADPLLFAALASAEEVLFLTQSEHDNVELEMRCPVRTDGKQTKHSLVAVGRRRTLCSGSMNAPFGSVAAPP